MLERRARRPLVRGGTAIALCWALACGGCTEGESNPTAAFDAARARAASAEREWRTYLSDGASTQSSALTQIHAGNVGQLEVAWTYDAGGASAGSQMACNPIVVRGVLYGTSPTLRVFALDAATGQELWSFAAENDERPGVNTNRGVTYWADGEDERILFTVGRWLHALDARTGHSIGSFGDGGKVDLRIGLRDEPVADFVVSTTPGTIYRDLLLLGTRVSEAKGAAPGHVRAYDVRSGEIRWTFHTIPRPGEYGYETWPADAWESVGGANSWAGITVDAERGLAFVPTGSAAFDFYGADRLGDNLFANSLVALDAATGERRWHFQFVRHDVWDRDLPSPPNLITVDRDGRRVDAVAQTTKTGHVFVFDRETGDPLFPMSLAEVEGTPLPGDRLVPTQPVPRVPPPLHPQRFDSSTITDRTPEARASVVERLQGMRMGGPFVAPGLDRTVVFPGFDGGAEWGGAAWDAERQLLFVNMNQIPYFLEMVESPEITGATSGGRLAYLATCSGCHGLDRRGSAGGAPSLVDLSERIGPFDLFRLIREGRGRMPAFPFFEWYEVAVLMWYLYFPGDDSQLARVRGDDPDAWLSPYMNTGYPRFQDHEGYPASKPPWGTLSAVDLRVGSIAWQVPLGTHPELIEQGVPPTGSENYGGPIVTAGGVLFIAATPDEMFRAYDPSNGQVLWETRLPAAGFATPSTYEAHGRQFVVVAAGGGKLERPSGSQYVAFALPR